MELGLPLRPMKTELSYTNWPLLPVCSRRTFPGIFTARDQFVVDIEKANLQRRVEGAYFDPETSHDEMQMVSSQAMEPANSFDPKPEREKLRERGILDDNFVRFDYRPFDLRWLYWEPKAKLLNRMPRRLLWAGIRRQLLDRGDATKSKRLRPARYLLDTTPALHIIERGANLYPDAAQGMVQLGRALRGRSKDARRLGDHFANLSDAALAYLDTMKGIADTPLLFHHAIAVLHAPEYAAENAAALRQDWPRVPLPASRADLLASAELGRRVAALLDPETPVDGVTAGKVPAVLKLIGVPVKTNRGQFVGRDFAVNAGLGYKQDFERETGQRVVSIMPGSGKLIEPL